MQRPQFWTNYCQNCVFIFFIWKVKPKVNFLFIQKSKERAHKICVTSVFITPLTLLYYVKRLTVHIAERATPLPEFLTADKSPSYKALPEEVFY